VVLTWTDNSSNETGFEIGRGGINQAPPNLTSIATVATNVTTFTITGCPDSGVSHHWYVKAVNAVAQSGWFGPIGKNCDGTDPPPAPANLVATSPQPGQVLLTWDDSPYESRYEISQFGTVVASPGQNVTNRLFSGLNAGTSYHWDVRACNAVGCGPWHGVVGKTPDGTP
jgi:hypothetical protein